MGGKERAQEHLEVIRKLTKEMMEGCIADAEVLTKQHGCVYGHVPRLAGKLFDARWEAFIHDSDARLFEE